jgi:hypothetical protein
MCGGVTADTMRQAAIAYRQVSNKTLKNRTEIVPSNWLQRLQPFYDKNLYPLEIHMAQIVRIMLDCGQFYLSGKFGNAGEISHPCKMTCSVPCYA